MYRTNKALFALVALHFATACALVFVLNDGGWEACFIDFDGGWAACDQTRHLRLINYFIQHPWSFLHYPDPWLVANLPGFHLFVASIARIFGLEHLDSNTWFRIIPFLFGLGVLCILWRTFRDLASDPWYALLLCLPILWSNYFYLPSLFVVTENAAYFGYVFLLAAYLRFPQRGLAIGLVGAATVFTRQIFLPVVATQFFAFPEGVLRRPLHRGRIAAVLLGALLPAAVVIIYLVAWGGPVPPEASRYHTTHAFIELGPVVQAWGLLGVLAVPYGFLVYPTLRGFDNRRLIAILVVASAAAFAFWILAPSTRDLDAGRAGSFVWLLARISPVIHGHALLVLPCLVLGFTAGGLMIELVRNRGYFPAELIMLMLYVAGLSMQLLSYQRYSEVVTLVALSATAARVGPVSRAGAPIFLAAFVAKFVVTIVMPQGG